MSVSETFWREVIERGREFGQSVVQGRCRTDTLSGAEPDVPSLLAKHFAWGEERDKPLFNCEQIGGGFITDH
jgi:hypothetical protein